MALPLLVTAAVYLNALGGGFVYDDDLQIVHNPLLGDWANLGHGFVTDVWHFYTRLQPEVQAAYYRPLFTAYLTVGYQLFGMTAWLWHGASLAVHLLAVAGAYGVARRTLPTGGACAAAALFGLHPVHSESVAWISGVTDPLMTALLFGAIILSSRPGRWPGLGGPALFAAALLTKETAFTFVVAIPLLMANEEEGRPSLRRLARRAAPYVAVAAAVFLLRLAVVGYVSLADPAWPQHGPWLLHLPWAFAFYLRLALLPVNLNLFYELPPIGSLGDGRFLGPLLLLAALAVVTAVHGRRHRVVREAVILFVLPLAPALNLVTFHPGTALHDRYLYLSAMAPALLVGWGLTRLAARFPHRRWGAVTVAALIACAALTYRRNTVWVDDDTLYLSALAGAPEHPWALEVAGGVHAERGQHDLARAEFEAAVLRDPWRADAWSQLALLDLMQGYGNVSALAKAKRAVEVRPTAYRLKNLALVHLDRGEAGEALDLVRRVVELEPTAAHRALLARVEAEAAAPP